MMRFIFISLMTTLYAFSAELSPIELKAEKAVKDLFANGQREEDRETRIKAIQFAIDSINDVLTNFPKETPQGKDVSPIEQYEWYSQVRNPKLWNLGGLLVVKPNLSLVIQPHKKQLEHLEAYRDGLKRMLKNPPIKVNRFDPYKQYKKMTKEQLTDEMFWQISKGDMKKVKFLIDLGADTKARQDKGGVIMTAAEDNRLEMLKYFYKKGFTNLNIKNKMGTTPLGQACNTPQNNLPLIKFLLSNKADPNLTQAYGNTCLSYAVAKNKLEIVKILIEKGVKLDVPNGYSLLYSASQGNVLSAPNYPEKKNLTIIEYLIKNGVKVNQQTPSGKTALMAASKRENIALVKLLIKHGAKTAIKDKNGKTAHKYTSNKKILEALPPK